MKKILSMVLVVVSMSCFAVSDATIKTIQSQLKSTLPMVKIDKISDTPIQNIYEVTSMHKIFYVDGSGRYALIGNLVDLSTKTNLTQLAVESISIVSWNELPLKIAIQKVIGNGKRKIAVFTDPDCPFCKRLEQETVPNLKNVTIYYFLFPLSSIHANAISDSQKILCSETPEATFTNWMKDNKSLPANTKCNNAKILKDMLDTGNKIGVEQTPTIILTDGKVIPGLIPADYLNQLIADSVKIESATAIESATHNIESGVRNVESKSTSKNNVGVLTVN